MMKFYPLMLTAVVLMIFCGLAQATVDFRVTSITGPTSDLSGGTSIGAASWAIQAVSDVGQSISLSTGPHSGFGIGAGGSNGHVMSLQPFTPGFFAIIEVEGVPLSDYSINGLFEVTHSNVSTSLAPIPIPGAGFNEYQSTIISDVPVTFSVGLNIFSPASDSVPAYTVIGDGTGSGDFTFHTLGPDNALTGIRNIAYDLVPSSQNGAVPEPGSVLVWGGLLGAAIVCYRRRKTCE